MTMTFLDIFWAVFPTPNPAEGITPLFWLAFVFFGVLVVLFGFVIGWRVRPLRRRADELEALCAQLDLQHQGMIRSASIWDDEVAPSLEAVEYLADSAREFREQCWELDGELHNANQAMDYFPPLVVDPGHAGFGGAVPGLLTALGILGTFVGITVGLGQIGGAGLTEASATTAQQADMLGKAVEELVHSLGVSFRTSIWGLIFSMVATATMTRAEGRLERALHSLVLWIDRAVGRGTEQSLLLKMVAGQERQLAELQGLAAEITEGFENAINGREGQGGLAGVLKDMSNQVAKSQSEGVEGLVNHFIDEMNDKLGQRFDELGGSIDTMVGANANYQQAMGSLVNQLGDSTEAQQQVAKTVADSVAQSTEAVARIGSTVEALSASAQSVRSASEGIGEVLDRQSAVMDRQESLSEELVEGLRSQESGWRAHQQAISESYEGIQKRFDGLGAAVQQLVEWHDRVKSELSEQVSAWAAAVQLQKELTAQFASERTRNAELLAGLGDATSSFAELGGGLRQLAEQLRAQIGDAQTAQSQGAQRVAEAAGHLDQVGKTLGATWEQYRGVASELNEALPNITSLLEGINQSVAAQTNVVTAGREIASQMQQTAAAQKEIRQGFEAIARAGEATRAALQPVAAAIAEGAEVLNEAAEGLATSSSGVSELATGLRATVDGLARQQKDATDSWNRVAAAVERTSHELDAGMTSYSERVNSSLKGALSEFDGELKAAVGALGEAIFSLQETIETIDAAGSRLTDGSDD